MPELPEMEITARRLDRALGGETIESATAPGINALKTFDPPLQALVGATFTGARRRGKLLLLDVDAPDRGPLVLLAHLMSAGRMQLLDKRASLRDKTSRLLVRISDPAHPDRELRLREFGTKQAAWVKLLTPDAVEEEDQIATLGPEAWPEPPADLRERRRDRGGLLGPAHVAGGRRHGDERLELALGARRDLCCGRFHPGIHGPRRYRARGRHGASGRCSLPPHG